MRGLGYSATRNGTPKAVEGRKALETVVGSEWKFMAGLPLHSGMEAEKDTFALSSC